MGPRLFSLSKWVSEPKHRFFIVVQLLSIVLVLAFLALAFFAKWLPPPGIAVAVSAGLAVVMSLQQDMRRSHKAIWMLLIGAFLAIELAAIPHERDQQDAKQARVLREEREHFAEIGSRLQEEIADSQNDFDATMQDSRQHFDATMNRSAALYKAESKTTHLALHSLQQTEGGDGYCWLVPISPGVTADAPWSVVVSCSDNGKLPVVDVFVMLHEALSAHPTPEEIDAKLWHQRNYHLGTLPPNSWEPTDIELKPGRYDVSIFSRRNATSEQLSFGEDPEVGRRDDKYCVYQYRTGRLLTGGKDCRNPR